LTNRALLGVGCGGSTSGLPTSYSKLEAGTPNDRS
jgi:hypothetical protein